MIELTEGGVGPCVRDRQMMVVAISDSYVTTDCVLTNIYYTILIT